MHRFDRTERLVLDNGVLCRVVTAHGVCRQEGESMDVAKIYEDGRMFFRNIECQPIVGWSICWPGETYRSKYYSRQWTQKTEPWQETDCNLSNLCWQTPSEADRAVFCEKYPEFRWIFAKSDLSTRDYFHLLPYWKEHPHEVELLLANDYIHLALDGRLWKAKDRKPILEWLRRNPDIGNPSLDGVRCCVKFGCTYQEWRSYWNETGCDCRLDYDVFRWLKAGLKRNHSLYSEVRLYRDYAKMAKEADHDMADRYWRFPKSLKKAHDKVMAEVALVRAARKAEEQKAKGQKYLKAVAGWLGKAMQVGKGMCVYVPESVDDIVFQAEALKQCLVTADYIGKVIDGRCVLVFVRYRGKPVATAEILPGGKLGQFYGNESDHTNCKPTKAATVALNAWMAKYAKAKKKKTSRRRKAA